MNEDDKIIDIGKELKKQERRQWIETQKRKALQWWDENKGTIVIVAPVVGGVLAKLIKAIGRHHNLVLERRNKDLRIYDASLGHYWELNHKLRKEDWIQINRRKNLGESLGEILNSMKVLK